MRFFTIGLIVVLIWGCEDKEAVPPITRTATPLNLSTVATISGQIVFTGPVSQQPPLQMGGFAACAVQHPEPAYPGDLLVTNGRLQNVFLYVKEGLGDRVFDIPPEPVTIDQKGCLYFPRVVGLQVHQPLRFVNSDPTLHNVHGVPKHSRAWNFGMGVQGMTRTITIDKPEVMIEVGCDLHPWMKGYVGVLDHPYFAVTGADGTFALRNLPPGEYLLEAWHERLGTQSQRVSLAPKEAKEITFTFAIRQPD